MFALISSPKRPKKWRDGDWILNHDNAPKHTSKHRFEATEDIKQNSTKTLLDIPKEEFTKCFQQWQKRWAKCVAVEGNYVEDN